MARGDVLLINLPASDGREQSGKRPAVAVQTEVAGEPMLIGRARYFKSKRFAFCLFRSD